MATHNSRSPYTLNGERTSNKCSACRISRHATPHQATHPPPHATCRAKALAAMQPARPQQPLDLLARHAPSDDIGKPRRQLGRTAVHGARTRVPLMLRDQRLQIQRTPQDGQSPALMPNGAAIRWPHSVQETTVTRGSRSRIMPSKSMSVACRSSMRSGVLPLAARLLRLEMALRHALRHDSGLSRL